MILNSKATFINGFDLVNDEPANSTLLPPSILLGPFEFAVNVSFVFFLR